MDADTTRSGKGLKRQRKPHRKSRKGCQNCKLRSVKCDEAKPGCERCATSGFMCSYTASCSRGQVLELAHKGSFTVLLEKPTVQRTVVAELAAPNPHITIPAVPSWVTRGDQFELSRSDLRLLHDFHKTVFHRMGSPLARDRCASFMQSLATRQPYILHSYLAITYIYQRDLYISSGMPVPPNSQAALAFHWYQASAIHKNTLLATDHSSSEKDAIWHAATLLGHAAFHYLDTYDPAKHWPNKPTESGDLYWLRLSIGKAAVWKLADPFREDSLFRGLAVDICSWEAPMPNKTIPAGVFPPSFMALFELDENSTVDNNLYFGPVSMLAQLLPQPCDAEHMLGFVTFPKDLNDGFCSLLAAKEPRALLILCWWWAKTCVYEEWWLSRRARIESRAICIYLENNYGYDNTLMELLEFPRMVLELVERSVPLAMTRSTSFSARALPVAH